MNILNIHDYPPFEGGGIEVNVSRTSALMVQQGHSVKIATPRFSSETYQNGHTLELDGVQAVRLVSLDQLYSLIREADVVHVHFTFSCRIASMEAMSYCVRVGKKCIVSIHTSHEHIPFSSLRQLTELERDVVFSRVSTLFQSSSVVLVAPSSCIQKSLEWLGIEKSLKIIPNGVALEPKIEGIPIEPVDITYLGEVSFLKGVQYIIECTNRLKRKFPNIKVRLIGGGTETEYLKQLVTALDLEENIEFLGYIPHIHVFDYLSKTKVHLHPSLTEVWPGAILESMSLGNTIVASDVGGIREMTDNGTLAYLFPKGDTLEMIDILDNLLSKQDVEVNTRVKSFVNSRFTIAKQTRSTITFYKQVYEQ